MPGPETRVEIEAVRDGLDAQSERISEQRADMREIRGDLKALDGRMDADERALVELRADVRALTGAVDGLVKQQGALLDECRALRGALTEIKAEVVKAREMAENPIAVISGRAKAAGGVAGGGILGVVYLIGKAKGWWE